MSKMKVYDYIRSKPEGQYVQAHQMIKRGIMESREELLPILHELVKEGLLSMHHGPHIGSKFAWFWGSHEKKISLLMALPRTRPYRFSIEGEKAIHEKMYAGMRIAMIARGL
jgi:hypothetical protein